MTNPFLSRENFSPQTAIHVAEAYERNRARDRAAGEPLVGELSVRSLADVVKSATTEAEDQRSNSLGGLDQILNLDVRQAFEDSFVVTEQLFDRVNLVAPTIEQCVDAGVDLEVLANAYECLQTEGLEPAIVLAPNLRMDEWRQLYLRLADDPVTNSDSFLLGSGFYVNLDVARKWDSLATSPSDTSTILIPSARSRAGEALSWSLRLIPATPRPTIANIAHDHNQANHPTICEYLTLQATRFQNHQEPIDQHEHRTWLSGVVTDGLWAPVGNYTSNHVAINWAPVYGGSSRLGARLIPRLPQ